MILDVLGLFLLLAGFIIGLGAVTVIETIGFLARTSPYWSEATIRTHKVTKPLIWLGLFLAVAGGILFYWNAGLSGIPLLHAAIAVILVANGFYLSFVISPFLLKQEREGKAQEILPKDLQRKITLSFFVSIIGWWGSLLLLIWYLLAMV